MDGASNRVNIRPGVSILSVLRHLNYKPWFALAEFVDNSLQSFLSYCKELKAIEGPELQLEVDIQIDPTDEGRIIIRDNAAGIHQADYARAFRPAEIPPDQSGLSEFGMGMKSASCWFANRWTVRTSALGEKIESTINFDIQKIIKDDIEELVIQSLPASPNHHYTEIILSCLNQLPQKRTISKIKEHLTSIYRIFIRKKILKLTFNGEALVYPEPKILHAPFYKDLSGPIQLWRKEIDFDFGLGLKVRGFAALRETGNTANAGFGLFRRDRLIEGSGEDSYRPEVIFGRHNSFIYQRLFGELHLSGFDVSHTKDGFRWEEHEDIFLELLKDELDKAPLPLLEQAEGHRVKLKTKDLIIGAEKATEHTADAIRRDVPQVLQRQLEAQPVVHAPPTELPIATKASQKIIDLELNNCRWQIILELSNDPAVGDWVSIYDQLVSDGTLFDSNIRRIGVRLSLAHPFMEQFGGTDAQQIEPLLRVAAAIVLAETAARDGGVKMAGTIRRNINDLLRNSLSKP